MVLFTFAASLLLLTIASAPVVLLTLGIRQYRWWTGVRLRSVHLPHDRREPRED